MRLMNWTLGLRVLGRTRPNNHPQILILSGCQTNMASVNRLVYLSDSKYLPDLCHGLYFTRRS